MLRKVSEFRGMNQILQIMNENEEEKSKVEIESKVWYEEENKMQTREISDIQIEKLKRRRMVNFTFKDTLWSLF